MTGNIHKTAIVSPMARLGRNVIIGPYSVIHSGVTLNDDVIIRSHSVIGSPAEKTGFMTADGLGVEIGEGTHISEHVTIHSGIIRKTMIGKYCLLLTKSHVGHCSEIGNGSVISCAVLVGGETIVGEGANLGLGSITHQKSRIGAWSFLGAGAVVPKNRRILPGNIYVGAPAKFLKKNEIGLQRMNISDAELWRCQNNYILDTPDWKHK